MKVILLNGSPHQKGCTYTALHEIQNVLTQQEIDTEIFDIGTKPVGGCIACGYCYKNSKCYMEDRVNEFVKKADSADGFVFGSPVYYASANGSLVSFLDRVFQSGGQSMRGKPGTAIVSCRRGGSTAALDSLNKYFAYNNMPVVSSQYWNMVHGNSPDEVKQDLEGLQIMRTLGNNMAWLLKCIQLGKENGIELPQAEPWQRTNFIR
ncbi:flavodoxin family protein [Lacrimispora defluvii]|uniref:Flavodoxin family protein n=1 Tax=Lacrimispora defluvii TaxID=2719233 RepID=A0ABX1W1L5_9FIRM|nr:flavodoxin family protein [Lacrimispora defluvii]NNJ32957.1 flavodoxin family protein [Lacrimispora defluvii]